MIELKRELKDLKSAELDFIFDISFPEIPESYKQNRIVNYVNANYDNDNDYPNLEYISIYNLGCHLTIWNDYSIKIESEVNSAKTINILEITNALIKIEAIKIKQNEN